MTAQRLPAKPGTKPRHRPRPKHRPLLAGLVGGILLFTGCTSEPQLESLPSTTKGELVFAHTPDVPSQALAGVYVEMLESAGVDARLGEPVADPVAAVLDGKADAVIAGSGDLLGALDQEALTGSAASAAAPSTSAAPSGSASDSGSGTPSDSPAEAELALSAEQKLERLHALEVDGFVVLDSADAARTGTLVTTAATSAGKGFNALAQLTGLCPELDFGIPDALSDGLLSGLEEVYACTPGRVVTIVPQDDSPVEPLITDQVQVLATTSDNAGIPDNGLVVLQDGQSLFERQTVTPLLATGQLGQDAIDAINKVSETLKQEDLVTLYRAVTGRDALSWQDAAVDWLREKSLVAKP